MAGLSSEWVSPGYAGGDGPICAVIPVLLDASPCNAGLVGKDEHLRPIPESDLAEDTSHVSLDGRLAHRKRLGNLPIAEHASDQLQDLEVSRRETGQSLMRNDERRLGFREALDQPADNRRCQEPVAHDHLADVLA